MAEEKLINYIKEQSEKGIDREQIKRMLLESGWEERDINEAFDLISNPANVSPPPKPKITVLPGVLKILSRTFSLYKKRFKLFLGIATAILPFSVVYHFLFADSLILDSFFLLFLFLVFYIPIFLWMELALIYAIKSSEEEIGIIEAYRKGWRKIHSSLWIHFLIGLIFMGGFFLLFIPGIIFAVWFILAIFILVFEEFKGMDALIKSREYVRGKWWGISWRILCVFVLFSITFGLLDYFLSKFVPFGDFLYRTFALLLLNPLMTIYYFYIYDDLKSLKGEFEFVSNKKRKLKYFIFFVIGSLLIVAVFSSVLVGLDSFRGAVYDEAHEKNMWQIKIELDTYYNNYGNYPHSLDVLPEEIPVNPVTSFPYQYECCDKEGYKLCVQLSSGEEFCITPSTIKPVNM